MSIKQHCLFEFGEFHLDVNQGILRSRRREIPLAPKVFETLLVLVENHGVVVDKDHLLKRIWPDAFVEEGSLTRNISILRRALGESADDQKYIQTIPKRGYRFIAPVKTIVDDGPVLVVEEQTRVQTTFDVELEPAAPETLSVTMPAKEPTNVARPLDSRVISTRRRYLSWSAVGLTLASMVMGVTWYRKSPDRHVMRLQMSVAPADGLIGMACPIVALSPDGSRVAYIAQQDNARQLYLRPMDSQEAKPIPGTEGAFCTPFFSPDGQWLAFNSGGWLRKIALTGGSPVKIVRTPEGVLGASWGDDGNIVFSAHPTRGLERVSASGGTAKSITAVATDKGETSHRWPAVLPGSKALLYAVAKEGRDEGTEIVLERLDTGERRVLIPDGTFPNYVSTGYLVYVREGTMMAVPFDVSRLEITGAAVPVEEHVRQSGQGAAQFGLSRFGSVVYVPSDSTNIVADNETLVWVDRNGNAIPVGAPPRVYKGLKLSPDGQTLAVSVHGRVLTRLTFGSGSNRFPIWTADGKRVLFFATRTGIPQIYWKSADGSGAEEQLTNNQYPINLGTVSPDGSLLLYSEYNPESGSDIWSIDLSANHKSHPVLQTRYNEVAPAISPDGRWLAYISDESGRNEVYVQPFPGSGPKWQLSTEGGTEPVWAHSGKELFYRKGDRMLAVPIMAAASSPPTFVAGSPQLLFEAHYENARSPWPDYDVSADDQRFLMIREETATRFNVVLNLFEEFR